MLPGVMPGQNSAREICTPVASPFLAPLGPRAHNPRMQTAVTLTLNGEARAFDGPITVAALLATLGLEHARWR